MSESEMNTIGVKKKRWIVCFDNAILELNLSVYEKMVYIVLCSHAKKDGSCYPSMNTIAREASCSRTKVFEALKTLEERGIIIRSNQVYGNRGQTSNLYEILDIDPRPQDGPGGTQGEWGPSATRTGGCTPDGRGECATRTGPVREADGHIMVLEQYPMNNTSRTKPPLPPQEIEEGEERKKEREAEESKTEKSKPGPSETGPIAGEIAKTEHCLYEAIVEEYDTILPELPRVEKITPPRAETLKRRMDEDPARREVEWWRRYFRQVREFPWPMGDNPNGWYADFDWLTGDRGMQKILEGRFRKTQNSKSQYFEGRTQAGVELQRKYTNERGEVDAWALLRELDP
jgi:predicted transcriptional regulator